MPEDLQLAEAQEQVSVLKAALESLFTDVETANDVYVDEETLNKLDAAGFEYDPLGIHWTYSVKCKLDGAIDPSEKVHQTDEAANVAWDRFTEELREIVLKKPEELRHVFFIELSEAT